MSSCMIGLEVMKTSAYADTYVEAMLHSLLPLLLMIGRTQVLR